MCDVSERLIAWLDRELPAQQAAAMELHLRTCAECWRSLDAYKELDHAIVAYCDSVVPSPVRCELPRWTPAILAAAAAALLMLFPHGHIDHSPQPLQAATYSPVILEPTAQPAPRTPAIKPVTTRPAIKNARKAPTVVPAQTQSTEWIPAEPAIQIAIPAEAMFAPGAVPQGVSFIAEVSIAADGSAQHLRLRP